MNSVKVQIPTNESFRRQVAEAVVKEAHPGYHGQGHYYVSVDTWAIVHKGQNDLFFAEHLVSVNDLVDQDHNDFSPAVEWRNVPTETIDDWCEMLSAYIYDEDAGGGEFNPDGSIPDWVNVIDVIAFAREQKPEWEQIIASIEEMHEEIAVEFCLSNFLDEVELG